MRSRYPAIAVPAFLLLTASLHSQAPDTVVLRSGDLVVGGPVVPAGNLAFDTEEMGVVQIDWDGVATLTGAQSFDVTLACSTSVGSSQRVRRCS